MEMKEREHTILKYIFDHPSSIVSGQIVVAK
jgi:hypothetical protein